MATVLLKFSAATVTKNTKAETGANAGPTVMR